MIFDVEADGLLDGATKIHVLAYTNSEGGVSYTHDYDEMREILTSQKILIGHNIICYDIPVLERILGIKIKARLIDTLALSWYANHSRVRHGLETYGEDFGVPKPKIDDWQNLTKEEYAHRCVEDVKINSLLWGQLWNKLLKIYVYEKDADRLIRYLSFKMDCLREQARSRWKFDKKRTEDALEILYKEQEEKLGHLTVAMPKVKKFGKKTRPAKPYKKDGTYSVLGAKWFKLLKDKGLPQDYNGEVEVFLCEVDPKPKSNPQIKDWLYSLGWVPRNFKYIRDEDGTERKIPQVRVDGDEGKELCPSVKELIQDNPDVGILEGLSVINHRISIFEGFLKAEVDGYLIAEAQGLTNTLRFKHKVLVNLPGVDKAWGEEIRGSLISEDGYELLGSDMCSLESTTKRHYMYPYDPEYVEEMSKPGFDEHLDLAKLAGEVTQEAIDLYMKEKTPEVHKIRKKFKPANYAGIYGVKKKTLSRTTGLSEYEAQELLDIYWKRNWSVLKVVENTTTKTVDGEMWLFNPVSRLWYSLRNEKDIFSTLNQGTGVFCFDSWIRAFRKKRSQLTGQFHDEVILHIKVGHREAATKLLKDAIHEVNQELGLNVDLDVDVQFGNTYAEIH